MKFGETGARLHLAQVRRTTHVRLGARRVPANRRRQRILLFSIDIQQYSKGRKGEQNERTAIGRSTYSALNIDTCSECSKVMLCPSCSLRLAVRPITYIPFDYQHKISPRLTYITIHTSMDTNTPLPPYSSPAHS
jgi:hypothetical protein